jgi:hypothetical protein
LHGSEGGDLTLGAHLQFVTEPVTAVAGPNAGAGAPVPVVTFSTPWTIPPHLNTFPHAIANPDNAATQGLGIYISSVDLTGFSLSCATHTSPNQANTVYSFSYLVLG